MNNYYRNPEDEEERRREAMRKKKSWEMYRCIRARDTNRFKDLMRTTNLTDGWRMISQKPFLLHEIIRRYFFTPGQTGEDPMELLRMVYEEFITPPRSMWNIENYNYQTIWDLALSTKNAQLIDFLAQRAVRRDITVSNDRRGPSAEPLLESLLDKVSMLSITKEDLQKETLDCLARVVGSTILHKRMSQVIGMEDAQKKKMWNEKIMRVLQAFFESNGRSTTFYTDIAGNTFLHLAILGRNVDATQFLMQNGFHHDLQNAMGMTPLNLAVEANDIRLFKCLCYIGARIHWFFESENDRTRGMIQAIRTRPLLAREATAIHNLQKQAANSRLQQFKGALRGLKVLSNLNTYMVKSAHNCIDGRTFYIKSEDINVPGKEYALALLPVRYSAKVIEIVDCLVELESPPVFLNHSLVELVIDSKLKSNFYELEPNRSTYIEIQLRDGKKHYNSMLAVIISFDSTKNGPSNRNKAGPSSTQSARLHEPPHNGYQQRRRLEQ